MMGSLSCPTPQTEPGVVIAQRLHSAQHVGGTISVGEMGEAATIGRIPGLAWGGTRLNAHLLGPWVVFRVLLGPLGQPHPPLPYSPSSNRGGKPGD